MKVSKQRREYMEIKSAFVNARKGLLNLKNISKSDKKGQRFIRVVNDVKSSVTTTKSPCYLCQTHTLFTTVRNNELVHWCGCE